MTNAHFDAVVIGGGAAGLSAAQALGRSLRRTLVIDAGEPRNRFAARMHNVLGLDGVPPLELLARGRAEAAAYGVETVPGEVLAVTEIRVAGGDDAAGGDDSDRGLVVEFRRHGPEVSGAVPGEVPGAERGDGANGETVTVTTSALVIASGVRDTLPDVPGLADHWGRTVLHCPYCHGWEVRASRLAVLATGPISLHQATLIRQWSERFTVFTAGLGELEPDAERELRARGTRIVSEPVTEVLGDDTGVTGVRTADGSEHAVDAIFTMGALTPHDGFVAGLELDRTETPFGSFLAVDPTGRTSHPRVWAVGNVTNPMATVPIAMGAGVQAGGAVNFALVEADVAAALRAEDAA